MSKFVDWLLGPDLTARADETPQHDPSKALVPPARDAAGNGIVGAKEALGLSMVYRAVQIHAIAAKQMSIGVVNSSGKPAATVPALIRKPNLDITRSAFVEQCVVSLASQGNAYWELTRDGNDRVINIDVLNPLDVEPEKDLAGKVTAWKYNKRTIQRKNMKHLALLRVPGEVKGLGPIQSAQVELRGSLDVRDYANNWFNKSGTPDGLLTSDSPLTAEQAKAARDRWEETQGGKRGTAVLGSGLDYRPIFLKPAEVQFIESQQFNVTQIARLFGVPSSLMLAAVQGGSQSYSNVEQDWLAYLRFTLMSYLIEIEDAFSELLPGNQRAKFNVEALLRTDTTTRYAAHKTAIEAGFQTINEVREIEGLAPLDEPVTPAAPAPAPTEQETAE